MILGIREEGFRGRSIMTGRRFFLWLLIGLLAAGCAEPTDGIVSGMVTIDGEPPKDGSMTFIPADGKSATSGAKIIDGRYTARVPLGTSKVQIHVSKIVGTQKLYNTPESPVQPLMVEVLPPRYNAQTELLLDVELGKNEKDFVLTTK
jgi:hypothetical protein